LYDKRVILNEVMATCHSITYVDEKLVGDPLEVKMFESTKWKLIEKNQGANSAIAGEDIVMAYARPEKYNYL
jgi:magnesium-transporting ATPase (P-type)